MLLWNISLIRSLNWSELLDVLINKEVHTSVVCVNHFFNIVQIRLL